MSHAEVMQKVDQVLNQNHFSKRDLINGLYAYIAKNGKIPFNINKAKQLYRDYEIEGLNRAVSKRPTRIISNRKQYDHWVKYGD